jgi:hypothetical protein
MLDQVAVVDEIHRLAFVDAGRPSRNVTGNTLTAIENVKLFDTCLRGLGQSETGAHYRQHCGPKTKCSIHAASPPDFQFSRLGL